MLLPSRNFWANPKGIILFYICLKWIGSVTFAKHHWCIMHCALLVPCVERIQKTRILH